MTNFGVRPFLDAFLELAQKPVARQSSQGAIDPLRPGFSGFVFKLQANMDPRHRDRVAFVRVCSGKFEKDMTVQHARTGRSIRLSRPQKLFGQDREVVEDAYPGDVIGLNNPGMFAIGDTLYVGPRIEYEGIPCFSPEIFSWLRNPNPSAFKSFRKGSMSCAKKGPFRCSMTPTRASAIRSWRPWASCSWRWSNTGWSTNMGWRPGLSPWASRWPAG